jgi:hypothetical protein
MRKPQVLTITVQAGKEQCCEGNTDKGGGEDPHGVILFIGITEKSGFHTVSEDYLQKCHPGIKVGQHPDIGDLRQSECPVIVTTTS